MNRVKLIAFGLSIGVTAICAVDCTDLYTVRAHHSASGPLALAVARCGSVGKNVKLRIYDGPSDAVIALESAEDYEKYLSAIKLADQELDKFVPKHPHCTHPIDVEISIEGKKNKYAACEQDSSSVAVEKLRLLAHYLHSRPIK